MTHDAQCTFGSSNKYIYNIKIGYISYFIFFPFVKNFIVQVQFSAFSPHLCPAPQLFPPPSYDSTLLCITAFLSTPLVMSEHLGCFQVLAIVNNTAMNSRVLTVFLISVLSFFEYIPRSGTAGSKGSSIFNF